MEAKTLKKIINSLNLSRDYKDKFFNFLYKGGNNENTSNKMIEVTYQQLVDLRNTANLIPGQSYRITDYECTTIQENTKSAGHQFDIIVMADDEKTLNENARAINHKGDEYFKDCNIAVWELKYTIDNDNTKFIWADNNGKGVIYYIKDEWNNECPYDFKNIMFNGDWGYYAYTFNWINDESDNSCEDLSVMQFTHMNTDDGYSHTFNNVIKQYGYDANTVSIGYPYKLNFIVFLYLDSYNDGFFYGCYNNTFEDNCVNNIFNTNCYNNSFGSYCNNNIFGSNCNNNTFGNYCNNNTFGNDCNNNTFGNYCRNNVFGNYYDNIILGNNCYNNIFGKNKSSIINYCSTITFGSEVHHNKIYGTVTQPDEYIFQNIHICSETTNMNIQIYPGRTSEIYIGINSAGVLVQKCLLDDAS